MLWCVLYGGTVWWSYRLVYYVVHCMLWRVLYEGCVWWYYGQVCYEVYCIEVLFGGSNGLFVMRCILYRGTVWW